MKSPPSSLVSAAALSSCLLGAMIVHAPHGRAAAPASETEPAPNHLDILIFAPHPDDEALCCTGVILQAIEQGKRVGVAVITNGDGFPKAAAVAVDKPLEELTSTDFLELAGVRQRHTLDGMTDLGVRPEDIVFLSYPDSGLEKIYNSDESAPYRQEFTGKSETYSLWAPDYHFSGHGRPAPYFKASLLADITEIIQVRRPKQIYVTHETDTHSDHRASYWYVRDVARSTDFQGDLLAYVNHGDGPSNLPIRRVPLTPAQVNRKRDLIVDYTARIESIHSHLTSYAEPDELFWPISLD